MMPIQSAVLGLICLLLFTSQPPATVDVVITNRLHHLRFGPDREWSDFPERAEASELTIPFRTKANQKARTLRVRHQDLKQPWRVALNGREIAQLPLDESDMFTYWDVPAGTLNDGANEMRIHCTGRGSDDVRLGQVTLIDRPREELLSEATVTVTVHEAPGARITSSRLTVTDDHGTLVALGNASRSGQAVRPGVIYSVAESVQLKLPAGRYTIYAGRGFEYGVARADVEVTRGSRISRTLTIRREVDTSGWAAMDTHVHTGTFARHGDATIDERMLTIAGEGIELPVSTEHDMRVDFDRPARASGARRYFTPILGSEVTTPSIGHFNVFPLTPESKSIDQRAPDWRRLREAIAAVATDPVIVLNHGRDAHGDFRPLGRARFVSAAGEDIQSWPLPANAMEVVNSGAVMTDGLALPRDWMGMLNRGLTLTPVGSSDSHDVTRYIVGQARTYVRCDDHNPGAIDPAAALERVRRGQVMVSYGLIAELDVETKGSGELVAPDGDLDVRIRVKGPSWTRANQVTLYVNGVKAREQKIPHAPNTAVTWEDTWRLPRPSHDVYLVAIAQGPGVSAPYWPTAKPYQPTSIEFTPYVLGLSGAVFVDADRSGRFESAFEYATREVASSNDTQSLVKRLASYDAAVATQAASILRARDPDGFERTVRSLIPASAKPVAEGFAAYLDAWKESQSPR